METRPRLIALSGPHRGQIYEVGEDGISIGRVGAAALEIDHMSVSRRHCSVAKDGPSFRIKDLGSLNGTFVNGKRVAEHMLRHGDRIMVGPAVFVFLTEDEDLSSLLSDVRLSEGEIDLGRTIALGREDNPYLHPERTVVGAADSTIVRGFAAVLKLSTTLRSSQTLAALEENALQLVMDVIPATAGVILLTGSRPDDFLSVYGKTEEGTDIPNVSRTVVARVLKDKTALLSNDVSESLPDNRSLILSQVRSILCVPLLSGDRAIGVIYLIHLMPEPRFEPAHLQLLTAMAAMLALPLEKALQLERLERENRQLRTDIDEEHRLIGDSVAMKAVYKFIARVAPTDSTVLIRGESGTGKELVARALHRTSQRAGAPFVAVNCAALREELIESELFGHEKGAFTSAVAQRKGKLEIANGGTVFLDEVAELAPEVQVKLLRVLQEREFERIGGNHPIKVNVRVIAATNRDLEEAIQQGHFRHELYYRLNVVSVELPPLRHRKEDILPLADYFALRYASRCNRQILRISPEAQACLLHYDWPGNVRELQNTIERALVLGEGDMILLEDLPESIIESRPPSLAPLTGFHENVRETKRRLIQNALEQASGNHAEAAKLLGINRTYLHRLIRNLDLPKE